MMCKRLLYWLISPYRKYQDYKRLQKTLQELRKKDPFIYK